jgi:hypothetical protein
MYSGFNTHIYLMAYQITKIEEDEPISSMVIENIEMQSVIEGLDSIRNIYPMIEDIESFLLKIDSLEYE